MVIFQTQNNEDALRQPHAVFGGPRRRTGRAGASQRCGERHPEARSRRSSSPPVDMCTAAARSAQTAGSDGRCRNTWLEKDKWFVM